MAPPPPPTPDPRSRRQAAWLRSLGIASVAAFAGGVAVVGVQYGLSQVSAGYPPAVHGLVCAADTADPGQSLTLVESGGVLLPVVRLVSGATYECRLEAPGADYATWNVLGPQSGMRSGPIDTSLPCQSAQDFANQDAARLRLSTCQRGVAGPPGLYLIGVKVMVRGQHSFDRATLAVRVVAAAAEAPEPPRPQSLRLQPMLRLPARLQERTETADLAASFSEHGLLPQSRSFVRTVYRLQPEESFVSASFQARSAANASAVVVAYVPQSRSVTASFTLRSGSLVDRWRGWVSGTVAVRLSREEPARDVALPEAALAVPGSATVPLPEGVTAEAARLLLAVPGGAAVQLEPGQPAPLGGALVTARFEALHLVLDASPE
jgi:hypothetical protein